MIFIIILVKNHNNFVIGLIKCSFGENFFFLACEEGAGNCAGKVITILSLFLIAVTLPFSLCYVVKVVQV